jgi:hypothetical protein
MRLDRQTFFTCLERTTAAGGKKPSGLAPFNSLILCAHSELSPLFMAPLRRLVAMQIPRARGRAPIQRRWKEKDWKVTAIVTTIVVRRIIDPFPLRTYPRLNQRGWSNDSRDRQTSTRRSNMSKRRLRGRPNNLRDFPADRGKP